MNEVNGTLQPRGNRLSRKNHIRRIVNNKHRCEILKLANEKNLLIC